MNTEKLSTYHLKKKKEEKEKEKEKERNNWIERKDTLYYKQDQGAVIILRCQVPVCAEGSLNTYLAALDVGCGCEQPYVDEDLLGLAGNGGVGNGGMLPLPLI